MNKLNHISDTFSQLAGEPPPEQTAGHQFDTPALHDHLVGFPE